MDQNDPLSFIVQDLNAITADDDRYQAHFGELPSLSTASRRDRKAIKDFLLQKQLVIRFVRDALASAVDKQKEIADRNGRRNMYSFRVNDRVLLSTANLPTSALSTTLQNKKLRHRFIGPFKVLKRHGDAYTLDIPKTMRLHPTFYVGRLKPYRSSLTENQSDSLDQTSDRYESPTQPITDEQPSESLVVSPSDTVQESVDIPMSDSFGSQRDQVSADTENESSPQFLNRPPPLPLVDTHGDNRWIVDTIVDHRFLTKAQLRRITDSNGYLHMDRLSDQIKRQQDSRHNCCVYRVRWLGYQPDQDTWEVHDRLLEDVPDTVNEYRSTHSL